MTLTLKSPRLLLRDFTLEDWQDVHAYGSQLEACRFQAWGPDTPEESRAYVEGVVALAQARPRTGFHLAVVFPPTGTVIGAGGLDIRSQRFRSGELSYIIHPAYWKRGFATEVAHTLLAFGFTSLNLHRISATCDPRNLASERVLQKLGMHYEGRMRETMLIRDGWRDSVLYSLLEHEWRPEMPE
jgi:RimJ/RimL family protein N-acetyltransferase